MSDLDGATCGAVGKVQMSLPVPFSAADTLSRLSPVVADDSVPAGFVRCAPCRGEGGTDRPCTACGGRGHRRAVSQ